MKTGAPKKTEAMYARVRELCLSLEDVEERPSHGEPTFFVCNRVFVMYSADHHGDLRYALWCNVPEGAQEILLQSDPENFFFPPYVGKAGWVGLRLDRSASWKTVQSIVRDAYAFTRAKARKKRTSRASQRTRSARSRL
jgi:hypothetical protein